MTKFVLVRRKRESALKPTRIPTMSTRRKMDVVTSSLRTVLYCTLVRSLTVVARTPSTRMSINVRVITS